MVLLEQLPDLPLHSTCLPTWLARDRRIGGPQVVTFQDTIYAAAEALGKRRNDVWLIPVPMLALRAAAVLAGMLGMLWQPAARFAGALRFLVYSCAHDSGGQQVHARGWARCCKSSHIAALAVHARCGTLVPAPPCASHPCYIRHHSSKDSASFQLLTPCQCLPACLPARAVVGMSWGSRTVADHYASLRAQLDQQQRQRQQQEGEEAAPLVGAGKEE